MAVRACNWVMAIAAIVCVVGALIVASYGERAHGRHAVEVSPAACAHREPYIHSIHIQRRHRRAPTQPSVRGRPRAPRDGGRISNGHVHSGTRTPLHCHRIHPHRRNGGLRPSFEAGEEPRRRCRATLAEATRARNGARTHPNSAELMMRIDGHAGEASRAVRLPLPMVARGSPSRGPHR
jgi:hypothetical protein